jgi:hypothetical protein
MKSDCQHEWIKEKGSTTKICFWCGIPQVRKSTPVPRLKIPPAVAEPRWAMRKYKDTK